MLSRILKPCYVAALGVPTEVFRKAFSGVTPALDAESEPAQVRLNKQDLMKVFGAYGITNDQFDTVANQYRYNGSKGQMWRKTPATVTFRNGVVTAFTNTSPGCGYSSPPVVTVPGLPDVKAEVKLSYTTDFSKNGSVAGIALAPQEK